MAYRGHFLRSVQSAQAKSDSKAATAEDLFRTAYSGDATLQWHPHFLTIRNINSFTGHVERFEMAY